MPIGCFLMPGSENKKQKVCFRAILYVQKIKGRKYVTYTAKTGNGRKYGSQSSLRKESLGSKDRTGSLTAANDMPINITEIVSK